MVYSEKYNFIYLHNPRTAGKSIQSVLVSLDPGCMHTTGEDSSFEHRSSKRAKEFLGDRIWNDSFKFCFVRNPYSWFLSIFRYSLNWSHPHKQYSILIRDDKQLAIPSDGIIKKTHVILKESLLQFYWQQWNKGIKRNDAFFDYHVGQDEWASDEMDFIGRYEFLKFDFNRVCEIVGLEQTILPHLNKGLYTKRSYIDLEYSEAARKLVGILYEEDIVKFGYEKSLED